MSFWYLIECHKFVGLIQRGVTVANILYAFVRFFKEEAHRDAFVRGDLYMNRLKFFKEYEEELISNVGDEHEGLYAWLQPDKMTMTIDHPVTGEEIVVKGIAGPVTMGYSVHDNYHVYCMSTYHCDNTARFETFEAMQAHIAIDIQKGDLGEYCTIIDSQKFLERLDRCLTLEVQAGSRVGRGLVEYFDPEIFSGFFDGDQAILKKKNCFSHQKEYRVFVYNGTAGDDSRMLSIGDLSDISINCRKNELDKCFVMTPKA